MRAPAECEATKERLCSLAEYGKVKEVGKLPNSANLYACPAWCAFDMSKLPRRQQGSCHTIGTCCMMPVLAVCWWLLCGTDDETPTCACCQSADTCSASAAGDDMPMLVGNLVAILASGLVCIVVSLIKPDNYDWKTTREITMVDDAETGTPCALFPPCAWEGGVMAAQTKTRKY